ncbi:MAG: molybdopterin-containing oxidoreductase family protein, partial [Nannocystaceae bacterium]
QFQFDKTWLTGESLATRPRPRTFNMSSLGNALASDPSVRARALFRPLPTDPVATAADAGPPVHALIVYNSNPVAVNPDQQAVQAGLAREDLLTVVLEHFQTDTADYADYVLPATTQLEHWDLLKPYGHLYLGLNQPAIAPVGQSLPNTEIFRRLAAQLGHDGPEFRQTDRAILEEFIDRQQHPVFEGISFERLENEGYVRLNVPEPYLPYAEGGFSTPSGKLELYSQQMADAGYDPVPNYTPPRIDTSDTEGLACISPPARSFLNSSFVNIERLAKREKMPFVKLHPDDAAARGIADGQRVRVHNSTGSVLLVASVGDDVMPGVAVAPGVWWAKLSPDGCNINQVVPQGQTDMGGGALFYDVRIEVSGL